MFLNKKSHGENISDLDKILWVFINLFPTGWLLYIISVCVYIYYIYVYYSSLKTWYCRACGNPAGLLLLLAMLCSPHLRPLLRICSTQECSQNHTEGKQGELRL